VEELSRQRSKVRPACSPLGSLLASDSGRLPSPRPLPHLPAKALRMASRTALLRPSTVLEPVAGMVMLLVGQSL